MTALDSRPQVPTAPAVSREVAIRRANGVKSGRALTVRELDEMARSFPETVGATNVGDLNPYQVSLLGIGERSMQSEIEAREWHLSSPPVMHDGAWDPETAYRKQMAERGVL